MYSYSSEFYTIMINAGLIVVDLRLLQALNTTQASTGFTPAAPLPFPTATRQLIDLFRPSPAVMLNTDFTCESNKKQTPLLSIRKLFYFTFILCRDPIIVSNGQTWHRFFTYNGKSFHLRLKAIVCITQEKQSSNQ